MGEYFVNNHVYLRLIGDEAILLDLRRDEYLTLNQDQVNALRQIVRGWPVNSTARQAPSTDAMVSAFASNLLARGLVTTDDASGKSVTQPDIEPAEDSLLDQDSVTTSISLGCAAIFLAACIRTSLQLRLRPLNKIIATIEHRKRVQMPMSPRASSERLRSLVDAFMFMRPFVYTEHSKCLFDSLTLIHFLAAHEIFPNLVFGVRTRPFEAHAWVQQSRCAINCAAEYARAYSPIMVI